jgi:hypothetical protein
MPPPGAEALVIESVDLQVDAVQADKHHGVPGAQVRGDSLDEGTRPRARRPGDRFPDAD